jgi:ATP-dependent exoDNAse (exonuclease V) beta subunit
MVKPLTIYKASAGSGKTFTLATEYIKLLVRNPQSYRTILAVTFTNKATEEMKMRILSQLYGIVNKLEDSNDYLKKIMDETQMGEEQVRKQAAIALQLLLHNYNYFRVETIDTFFQSVLRNLARELDLTANLRIGLNDVQVEEQAVDRLIDHLTHQDVLLQWILKYIMETISENQSWNIIGKVKSFGRTIFRDYYKEQSDALKEKTGDEHFFTEYSKQLRDIRRDAQEHMKQLGDQFFDILHSEGLGLENLAYGKTGIAAFFVKLQRGEFDASIEGKRVVDCCEDPEKWSSKKGPFRDKIIMLADCTLIPLLRHALDVRPHQYKLFKSADLTLRHLNQLRLLGNIEQKVRELNEEANRFLLSDTQQLLHALIEESDSPFIFEKIGTQLEHIMIDEFQDTSTVQWQNFKVLLQECMSHVDTENLIVGDVKQSIYRWRSGDWRLLNAIDREFPTPQEMLDIRPLETNYRSLRRIIEFNNAFFTEAARQEYKQQREEYPEGAEQLRNAYLDVAQLIPAKRDNSGYVNIRLLPSEDYQERTLQLLAETTEELLEKGVKPKQIAILVRTNKVIPQIAEYFANALPKVSIVSDEAFRLDASIATSIIVQALHLLTHPDDTLAKATLAKLYQREVLKSEKAENELLIRQQPLDELLPEEYVSQQEQLQQMPLYELAERLYTLFRLEKLEEESAYICAFFDQLLKFTQDNSTDIDAFVREWEETIGSKTIQAEESDGLRILTIHKSKGLEFDHVLLPFSDWRMELSDILWCKPQEDPFAALPLAPIDYSEKQMRGTIYEHDYLDEHLQNTVDNLNLLYVAFTRASRSLFVIGKRDTKSSRSVLVQSVLPELKLEGGILEGEEDQEAILEYTYGEPISNNQQEVKKKQSENVFMQPVTPLPVSMTTFEAKTEFRQSNRSREFIEGEDEQAELSYIKIGSVLHQIFSTIRTTADIEKALQQLQNDGVLYDDEVTREKVSSMLRKRLESKRVSDWFSGRWNLYNECSILRINKDGKVEERRPDRVMTNGQETQVVDFKFGRPQPEHQEQVKEYVNLLKEMGMPQVKGWLWYVYSNKIEEVI